VIVLLKIFFDFFLIVGSFFVYDIIENRLKDFSVRFPFEVSKYKKIFSWAEQRLIAVYKMFCRDKPMFSNFDCGRFLFSQTKNQKNIATFSICVFCTYFYYWQKWNQQKSKVYWTKDLKCKRLESPNRFLSPLLFLCSIKITLCKYSMVAWWNEIPCNLILQH